MLSIVRFYFCLIGCFLIISCASTNRASYHYTQSQIAHGDLNFEGRLKVNEYLNGFSQDDLPAPSQTEVMILDVQPFIFSDIKNLKKDIVQVAIKTRSPSEKERKNSFGVCVVFDNSGSMSSDGKFSDAIASLKAMVAELKNGTEFALVVFNSESKIEISPVVVNPRSREKILEKIDSLKVGGGTEIMEGLLDGYRAMSKFHSKTSRLILLTDGISKVENTEPKLVAQKAGVRYLENSRISTIGLGHDVDENILRKIAQDGRGAYYFAENAKTLTKIMREDLHSLMIPVAQDIRLSISASEGYQISSVYGYEDLLSSDRKSVRINLGSMNVEDWRIIMVELERLNSGNASAHPLDAEVHFISLPEQKKISKKTFIQKFYQTAGADQSKVLNRSVARNAIILTDAMALIQISKLVKRDEYDQAARIANLQLKNIQFAKTWDQSEAMKKEEETFFSVRSILYKKGALPQEQQNEAAIDLTKKSNAEDQKIIVRTALKLAEKTMTGPWSVVVSLLGILVD